MLRSFCKSLSYQHQVIMSQFTFIKKSVSNQKPFCKVCKDAGKPESVYTSHWVRETPDIRSKVVCPTLLALECRYCHANNHTVKYCPVLKTKEKQDQEQSKPRPRPPTKMPAIGKPVRSNIFMCLDSDSEEAEVKVKVKKEEEQFPSLTKYPDEVDGFTPLKTPRSKSYATALSHTVQIIQEDRVKEDPDEFYERPPLNDEFPPLKTHRAPLKSYASLPEYKSVPWATSVQQNDMTSWADDCSSDEDEF